MTDGKPVGRRIILGVLALGVTGVVTGTAAQDALARLLKGAEEHDPTGLIGELPLGETFRYYSVTGGVRRESESDYRLAVSGLVTHPATYTFADLQRMPQTALVRDFQCVTGWRVPQVHWAGVALADLLEVVQPLPQATAVRFRSFDGAYTETMTLQQARRPDVIVALRMLGKPVTHDHGGPVRMYAAPMYGYKSTKWLSAIELTSTREPGYWEQRGYPLDGFIQN